VKSSDKKILMVVVGVVLLGVLWFGLISPKRAQLGELDGEVSTLQTEVTEKEQAATAAAGAQETYESDYRELISLGKAVPADDDSSSLIDQIDVLATDAGVEFIGLELTPGAGGGEAAPAPAPAAPAAPADPEAEAVDSAGENAASGDVAAAAGAAAPATETAAATLPLGAAIGPAGLPVMPYTLTFRGSFFDVADFLAAIDGMVKTGPDGVTVDGRLLTVDGFDLHPDEDGSDALFVTLTVTSYVAPADQGLAGAATPTAPVAAGTPATPATSDPAAAPTAAATAPTP
jgi:hypothetical protein